MINNLKYKFKRKNKFSFKKEIKSLELNKGLISEDRNNKATQESINYSATNKIIRMLDSERFLNLVFQTRRLGKLKFKNAMQPSKPIDTHVKRGNLSEKSRVIA